MKDFSLFLRRWLPVAAWFVVVLAASTGIASSGATGALLDALREWFGWSRGGASATEANFFVRKAAHFLQFFVFALLFWRGLRLPPALVERAGVCAAVVLGGSLGGAFLSEYVQMFFPNRNPALADVALDMAGAVCGVLAAAGLSRLGWLSPMPTIAGRFERLIVTPELRGFSDDWLRTLRVRVEAKRVPVLLLVPLASPLSLGEARRRFRQLPGQAKTLFLAKDPAPGCPAILGPGGMVRTAGVDLVLLGPTSEVSYGGDQVERARRLRHLVNCSAKDEKTLVVVNLHAFSHNENLLHDSCWMRLEPSSRDALRHPTLRALCVVDAWGVHTLEKHSDEVIPEERLIVSRDAEGYAEGDFASLGLCCPLHAGGRAQRIQLQ